MKLTDSLSQSPDVVAREVAGELVLLHLGSGLYFGLNSVGGHIWQALEEKDQSIASLCDVISAEFDAPRAEVEQDILALAASLLDQGLAERAKV
jgi:hypothetical protein